MAIIKELCDISRFEIKHPDYGIPKEKINEKIKETLKEHAILSDKKGPIENEDIVYLTFTGLTDDGKKFKGADGNNIAGIIGEGDFMLEFEQQLFGHYVGDNFDIFVTPKDDFHIQEVRNKNLKFNVTVNKISYQQLPELNNYFIKQLGIQNLNTVDDFIEFTKAAIDIEHLTYLDNASRNLVINQIINKSEFEIGEDEIDKEAKKTVKIFEEKLLYKGLILKEYLEAENMTKKDLEIKYRDESLRNIKIRTIITYLEKVLNIEVSDEELVKEAEQLDLEYGYSINDLINMGAGKKEAFRTDIKRKKVIEALLERTEISFI